MQQAGQLGFVEIGLGEQLFDAGLIFRPPNTGGDGDDVFGAENFGGRAFKVKVE